jgi:microcystin degradation protein MlrC
MAMRVLIGRLFHESHGFNPRATAGDCFTVLRGAALLDSLRDSGTTLGGIARRLARHGRELVPALSASAPPSGLVEHDFYEGVRDELLAATRRERADAIALELHGAMGTTALADAEGDLLTQLRAVVGPDVPIAIGLDLHGHVTRAMLRAADICIACKENPHADVVACGERVADCADAMLAGRLRPVTAMAKAPMFLGGAAETASGPLSDLHARARVLQAANPRLRDISLFNVFRYLDDHDMGQAVTVLADQDGAAATAAAEELARAFWDRRAEFRDDLLEIDAALDRVASARAGRPFVLADMGDRVLAGAPGDSTAILQRALRRRDGLRGAIPVTDADAAAAAIRAGAGATIDLAIGGRITPGFAPLAVSGTVTSVSDGAYVTRGPYQAGEHQAMGPTAVIAIDGRLSVLLMSRSGYSHDPEAFSSQGIDLAVQDFVVVKSGYHFKLNFAGIATPLVLATPGLGYYTKGLLRWTKARFYPEHPIENPEIRAELFTRSR